MKQMCLSLLVLLAVCIAPRVVSAEELWIADIKQALALADHRDQLLLVDLYADWCHWCKLLEREVFSTHRFKEFASQFVLLRVDTEDGGQGTRFVERLGTPSLPTTLILNPRMVKVAEVEGYLPTEKMIEALESQLAAYRALEQALAEFGEGDDPAILYTLGKELQARNDGERATELYRRLLEGPGVTPEQELSARFRLVNSLRLSQRFDEAQEELEQARILATAQQNNRLLEHLDLLAADLARERGDCRSALTYLQTFLERYPQSSLRPQARRTLYALRTNEGACS
ncbi:MAG: thioredoxin family protein [Thermoanaerobaculia bacterium]